jgi:hypothetical protein
MFTLAFFPVPGYVLTMAMRAIDLYIDCHSFIESSFVLFVIPPSSIHHTFWITSPVFFPYAPSRLNFLGDM